MEPPAGIEAPGIESAAADPSPGGTRSTGAFLACILLFASLWPAAFAYLGLVEARVPVGRGMSDGHFYDKSSGDYVEGLIYAGGFTLATTLLIALSMASLFYAITLRRSRPRVVVAGALGATLVTILFVVVAPTTLCTSTSCDYRGQIGLKTVLSALSHQSIDVRSLGN